ncbi:MAG TPA: general secretion pathway protein GspB [Acidobacteriota bacterium]|nr:general secretion pathway protein GspB [Acidobacteriota bacterium]
MSYILDALKKAEKERALARVPSLDTLHEMKSTGRTRIWAGSAVVLLLLAGALWFVFSFMQNGPDSAPPLVNDISPDNDRVAPDKTPMADNAAAPRDVRPPAEPPDRRDTQAAGPVFPKQRPLAAPPQAAEASRLTPQPPSGASTEGFDASFAQMEGQRQESLETLPDLKRAVFAPAPEPRPQETAPPGPATLRERMAGLTISVHLFSDNENERMVFINGRKYLEGDLIEGGCTVERITPEGAILRYDNERALLRPGPR